MMTVHALSERSGVSVRTLQYYDKIGLLPPAERTAAGYRLYDDASLERLQQILLFRELEFPLREIRRILSSPDFDRDLALRQQIQLLELRRERLDRLIAFAREIRQSGGKNNMDFSAFDREKLESYAAEARKTWGETPEYREFAQKDQGRTTEEHQALSAQMMAIFAEFGVLRGEDPAGENAQALVRKLQSFITEHFYRCSDKTLAGLGEMYASGGEFTENIDRAGGAGTAEFAARAIRVYCAGR